jgi:hypothetical protein
VAHREAPMVGVIFGFVAQILYAVLRLVLGILGIVL